MLFWKGLFFFCNILWWVLVVIGIFVFMGIVLQSEDLRWMVWFLPLWFILVFIAVFAGNFAKWRHWDER